MIKAKALRMADDPCAPETPPVPFVPEIQTSPLPPAEGVVSGADIRSIIPQNQDFIIESGKNQEPVPDCIIRLALQMIRKDALLKPFIRKLRQQYIEQQKAFSFSLNAWTPGERKEIQEFFSEELCGIVESVYCDRGCSILTGNLVFTSPARKFLTGEYMEIGVCEIIRQAMEELAVKYHAPYRIYRNVVVSTRNGLTKNEFDIVIECQGKFYVVEVKSGANYSSWGGLVEIGKTYGIVPHRLLLADSYLTEEKAGRIEYFCEYYVSTLEKDMLRNKVIEMVGNDLRKENTQ